MSTPTAYAFEPRRKRTVDSSDSDSENNNNIDALVPEENHDQQSLLSSGAQSESAGSGTNIATTCLQDVDILTDGVVAASSTSSEEIPEHKINCVLAIEEVRYLLTEPAVKVAWRKAQRVEGYRRPALLAFENMKPENFRFHAYQNYIEYVHGHLGHGRRKVIPSCVVQHIRKRYPDPDGRYTGFVAGDHEDRYLDEVICALNDF